jgi:nucleotide-binding universal stress UspA family protein
MISVTSILVDIDAVAADHPALKQAIELGARCGARLKIVDVLPWVPAGVRHFVTADVEKELLDHRRGRLKAIAAGVQKVPVTTELLRGRPGTALIQEVLQSGHDLVVRSHGRDLAETPRSFGAVDMELLRQCPCSVWLIGRHIPSDRPWRLLAAIHANPSDPGEQVLNRTILEWGLALKVLGGAQLTLLQAWTPYGASLLRSRMSSEEFAEFIEAERHAEDEALSGLLEPFKDRLTDVAVELVPGEPEDAIGRFVESHGIDVVVMGTVARTGIAGLVMGNTAERVLQRLRGSVLAVKPPGFESPVKRTS